MRQDYWYNIKDGWDDDSLRKVCNNMMGMQLFVSIIRPSVVSCRFQLIEVWFFTPIDFSLNIQFSLEIEESHTVCLFFTMVKPARKTINEEQNKSLATLFSHYFWKLSKKWPPQVQSDWSPFSKGTREMTLSGATETGITRQFKRLLEIG